MNDQPDTDLYQKHKQPKRQIFMGPAGFEPAIAASDRTQTHALDGAATGIGPLEFGK